MTLQEYTNEVQKRFVVGAKDVEEVRKFFNEAETKKMIEENYNYYAAELYHLGCSPEAVAYCLDLLY